MVKPVNRCYEIDKIASSRRHTVIRLPPYMSTYNPMELIGAQIKCEVSEKKKVLKMVLGEQLSNSAFDNISKKQWESCVQHAEKIQDEDFVKGYCKGQSHGQHYN
jgi:hypothetical protein